MDGKAEKHNWIDMGDVIPDTMTTQAPQCKKVVVDELEILYHNLETSEKLVDALASATRPVSRPWDIDEVPNRPSYSVPLADALSGTNRKIESVNAKLQSILNSLEI